MCSHIQMNDFVRDKFRHDDGRIELKYEILAGMTVSAALWRPHFSRGC